MAAPYGGQPQYQQQAQQPQYQQQAQQPQYQQQAQQQPQYQQQAQQQQQYQAPPVAMAPVEEEKKGNVGLIIGIIGGVIAILALVAFFVLGPDLGLGLGGDKDPEIADAKEEAPAPALGGIDLELTPADAMVEIDGKEYPGASPRKIPDLSVGKHTVEISKGEDYLPLTQEVTVSAGEALSLPLALQLRNVSLEIKVDPPAALVTLLAGTTPTEIGKDAAEHKHALKREPGVAYTLKAVAAGYDDASVPVTFTGEATQPLTVTLVKQTAAADPTPEADPDPAPVKTATTKKRPKAPAKPKNAELKIGVAPGSPPADVYVDGKKQSKKAPVFVKVTAGTHTVKWKWDDGKTDTQKVTVGANESKLLKGSK